MTTRDDPAIVALRDRVTATIDPAIKEDQVRATVTLKDGRTLEKFVEHVVGSIERPMSDADLEAKFAGLRRRRAAGRAGAHADGSLLEARDAAERGADRRVGAGGVTAVAGRRLDRRSGAIRS